MRHLIIIITLLLTIPTKAQDYIQLWGNHPDDFRKKAVRLYHMPAGNGIAKKATKVFRLPGSSTLTATTALCCSTAEACVATDIRHKFKTYRWLSTTSRLFCTHTTLSGYAVFRQVVTLAVRLPYISTKISTTYSTEICHKTTSAQISQL